MKEVTMYCNKDTTHSLSLLSTITIIIDVRGTMTFSTLYLKAEVSSILITAYDYRRGKPVQIEKSSTLFIVTNTDR